MRILIPVRSLAVSGIVALAALMATVGLGGGPTPAFALTNCTVADLTFDSEEQAFLTLINSYRAQNGKGALTASVNLNRAASWHDHDMATKNYFSHTDSLGRSSNTRMKQCDATVPGSGENIAAGTYRDTAQEVFDAWKASSGHNANMLNGSFKQIGIARFYTSTSKYKWYWTTDFSTADDGTRLSGGTGGGSTPSPTPTPAPIVATKATMSSPTPSSTLPGSSITFKWNAASTGVQEYFLYVGSSAGRNNYYGKSAGLNLSAAVPNLPTDGRTLYVRLWTKRNGSWQYNDYTYKAAP